MTWHREPQKEQTDRLPCLPARLFHFSLKPPRLVPEIKTHHNARPHHALRPTPHPPAFHPRRDPADLCPVFGKGRANLTAPGRTMAYEKLPRRRDFRLTTGDTRPVMRAIVGSLFRFAVGNGGHQARRWFTKSPVFSTSGTERLPCSEASALAEKSSELAGRKLPGQTL
jgi:hypothetical protein